jgi:hypothetical protein
MHPAAGVAQAAEVAHLAGQEGVIPAADEVDCRLDVCDLVAEYPGRPVRVAGCRPREPLLVEGDGLAEQKAIGSGERPGIECPQEPVAAQQRA